MLDREGYAGPEDAAIIGDEQTVSQRLDELAAAGVDEFVGVPLDPSAEGRWPHPFADAQQGVRPPEKALV